MVSKTNNNTVQIGLIPIKDLNLLRLASETRNLQSSCNDIEKSDDSSGVSHKIYNLTKIFNTITCAILIKLNIVGFLLIKDQYWWSYAYSS